MEKLVVNLTGGVRRERLDGRDYLVAPLTMIVPGVLSGSRGPILYQLDDIKASADSWNGMPIVVNHPAKPDGTPLSARSPKVFQDWGIGLIYEAKVVENRLTAEGWFDVEKTRKVNPRVLNALQNNQKIELSTGLNLDQEEANGVWNDANGNSVAYTSVARRYRPDHLAILPDQPGACSLRDGCGVNNVGPETGLLQKIISYITTLSATGGEATTNNQETDDMSKLTAEQRTAFVGTLVANCACYKDDKAGLEGLDDKALNAVHNAYQLAVENGKKLADAEKKMKELEEEKAAKAKAGETPAPVGNAEPKKELTDAEYLASLPPTMREDVIYARNAKEKERLSLIEKLVANRAEGEREAARKDLAGENIATLNRMLSFIPATPQSQAPAPLYFGAGAGQLPTPSVQNQDDNKPAGGALGVPVWNFDAPKK